MPKTLYKIKKRKPSASRRLVNNIEPGSVYGEWTTIGKGSKPDYLRCECTCGTFREVHVYSLTSGKSESCGCMRTRKKKEAVDAKSA